MNSPTKADSYYLNRLEVLNWGGFAGFHRADIHVQGTAVIGQTASGKTTLVDALMTLLTARPNYNLASTGGHESDRDLMGYIRGISGSGEDSVARSGKTVSAVAAYFQPLAAPGGDKTQGGLFAEAPHMPPPVALGAIFWIDSTSNQPRDRHDIWIFAEDGSTLRDWLHAFEEDGKRALKQRAKAQENFQTYDSKSSYLSKIQQFFEAGENAFRLLNRAVGLKQLNSIDEIFRELVLDDESLFAQAARCIAQFDDLSDIRHTLETAKKQQKSLAPLLPLQQKWQEWCAAIGENEQLIATLPYWYAWHGKTLWQQSLAAVQAEKREYQAQQNAWQEEADALAQQRDIAKAQYEQQGGNRLTLLQNRIEQQQKDNVRLEKSWQQYQLLSQKLSLSLAASPEELVVRQNIAAEKRERLQQEQQNLHSEFEQIIARKMHLESDIAATQTQLRQAEKQKSNIPPAFEQFRADLAAHLDCALEALPYVAQLIEVKPAEAAWRGAIERALGSHRLRLLVPREHMAQALHWVNGRHNRLHVRLLDENIADTEKSHLFADGFVHKLNIKPHPLSQALTALLASLDRHCVDNVAALQHSAHAMTREGTMSGKSGRFDKQDQKRLDDDWLTGFDNRDLLNQLSHTLQNLQTQHQAVEPQYQAIRQQLDTARQTDNLLDSFAQLQYADIDIASGEKTLAELQHAYAQLNAPGSTLAKLQQQCDELQTKLNQIHAQLDKCKNHLGVLQERERQHQEKADAAAGKLQHFAQSGDDFLASPHFAKLAQLCTTPSPADLAHIDEQEKDALRQLSQQQSDAEKARADTEKRIITQMNAAQQTDTGALAESGTDMADLPDYLQRLQYLTEEDLPGKEKRFADYLTQSSTESVSQLMSHIKSRIDHIKERIAGLNRILHSVDFDKDKYLQLNTTAVAHPGIKEFEQAYKKVNTFSLDVKNPNPEGHYAALRELITLLHIAVEKPERLASKALLDARHRLAFSIAIVARHGEQAPEIRTGSQRGSGGEKEIMASYILTASLNYALSPDGTQIPKFATIVLDEAFSKSSQSVAGRIVKAIHAFGLHPLFVTPNKEMRLLREHTHSAVLVHRKDKTATLSNWSWEKIDAAARQYLESSP